jgi:hypothetical protein
VTISFNEHCKESARGFIQTIIVIDDQASIGRVNDPSAKTAARVSGSLLSDATIVKPALPVAASTATPVGHDLDAQLLTDAFFNAGMIAGLYRPSSDLSDLVVLATSTVKIAKKSDVIIIDWSLNAKQPDLAKEIIAQVVDDDYKNGGRLRTIIVYTAEKDLVALKDQLLLYLNNAKIVDSTTRNGISFSSHGDFDITGAYLRISFYSKQSSATTSTDRKISESNLPDIVIFEFSKHADGLLPSFALRASSSIRDGTHHLLTRFPSNMDGAYLTHRGACPEPEDAEPYMLENFVSVVRNILSLERVDQDSLGEKQITTWLDREQQNGKTFTGKCNSPHNIEITPDELKPVFKEGVEKLKELAASKMNIPKNKIDEKMMDSVSVDFGRILVSNCLDNLYQFSVLSAFKRSHADTGWAKPSHIPYLTQGTIVAKYLAEDKFEFLLCVTPKCDSLRIGKHGGVPRMFSFAPLSEQRAGKPHDLILNHHGKYRFFKMQQKFYMLVHQEFVSSTTTRRVESVFSEVKNGFLFKDTLDCEYLWAGDLKDMNSQNRVTGLVSNLNRVGVDEFEWSRIVAKTN